MAAHSGAACSSSRKKRTYAAPLRRTVKLFTVPAVSGAAVFSRPRN